MPTIDDYRKKFPSLRDLGDYDLINRVAQVQGVDKEDVMTHMGYNPGDTTRGLKEAFQQLPQLAYGLMAGAGAAGEAALGEGGVMTGLKQAGLKGYQQWGDKIEAGARESDSLTYSWEQAQEGNFGALVDWLQHGIGYTAGQGLQALASAGIGAVGGKFVIGAAAKDIAKGMVLKETAALGATEVGKKLTQEALIQQATKNVASRIGQSVGVAGMAFGQEGGEIFGDLTATADKEDRTLSGAELAKAFGATVAAGGLEFVGDKLGLDLLMGKSKIGNKVMGLAEGATGVGGKLARGGLAGALAMPTEAGTEYFQTGIEEFGKGKEANALPWNQSPESQAGAFDAAALGALGGAAVSGVSGIMSRAKARDAAAQKTLATTTDVGEMTAAATEMAMVPLTPVVDKEVDNITQKRVDALAAATGQAVSTLDPEERITQARATLAERIAAMRGPEPALGDTTDAGVIAARQAAQANPPARQPTLAPFLEIEERIGHANDFIKRPEVREALRRRFGDTAVADTLSSLALAGREELPSRSREDALHLAELRMRAATVDVAGAKPRTGSTDGKPLDPSVPNAVEQYVKRMSEINTPAAIALTRDFNAGRITAEDVADVVGRAPKPADVVGDASARIETAAAKAPSILATDLVTADGMPYGTRAAAAVRNTREGGESSVIEVPGGYVVRPKGTNEPRMGESPVVPPAAVDGAGNQSGGSGADLRPGADGGQRSISGAAAPVPGAATPGPVGDGRRQPGDALIAAAAPDNQPATLPVAQTLKARVDEKKSAAAQAAQPAPEGETAAPPTAAPLKDRVDATRQPPALTPATSTDDKALDTAAHEAATSHLNDTKTPTLAQLGAGNYQKGHHRLASIGKDISIETAKGTERVAKDGSWRVPKMPAHYGDINRTEGADGDPVDLFIGDRGDNGRFWVINQHEAGDSSKFDEHKVVTGVESAEEAVAIYKASFADNYGDKVFTSISAELNADELNAMLPKLKKAKAVKAAPVATTPTEQPAAAPEAAASPTVPTPEPTAEDPFAKYDGVQIEQTIQIAETGQTATLKLDAGRALRALDERQRAVEKLRLCLQST